MIATIEVNACYTVKINKINPKKISNSGACARRSGPGSACAVILENHHYYITIIVGNQCSWIWWVTLSHEFNLVKKLELS